jgi:transposase
MSDTYSYLGIDIAKATFEVVLQAGPRQRGRGFNNDAAGFRALSCWLDKQGVGQVWAVQEATGRYGEALAHYLAEQGHIVSVVNPLRIKAYGQSQLRRAKTDRGDAALIADFGRAQSLTSRPLAPWTPPTPEQQHLRDLVRRLADVQQMRQQERNRLEAGTHAPVVQASLQDVLAVLEAQVEALQKAIQAHVEAHPALQHTSQLLTSIPGIGLLTAARLMVELPDIHTFTNPKQLVAYAGLAPTVHESGTSVHRRPHTSRKGNAVLRAQLFMPALVALRHNPVIQALQQRLQRAGKAKMVIVVAAMRKLLHLVYGILKSGRPFDPVLALSPGPGA